MRERLETLAKARERVCSLRTLACAFSLATILAMPAGAVDGTYTIPTGGGVVAVTNADEVTWVGDDLLIKFTTNSTSALAPGSFTLPGVSKVRILAIGGGGGGGGAYLKGTAGYSGNYGGGGGGGAGGFVDTNGFYSAATYSIVVGKGGVGGKIDASHGTQYNYNGENGDDTTITTNGSPMITAYGGGGGGGESVGLDGGSGGGGSMYRGAFSGTVKAGGTPKDESQEIGRAHV